MRPSSGEKAAQDAAALREAGLAQEERRDHGVVHTPVELCRFAVETLDASLRRAGLADGLRTEGLTVVDPACGTGAFFASLLEFAGAARPSLIGIDRDEMAIKSCRRAFGDIATWHVADATSSLALLPAEGPLAILGNPPWAGKSASRGPLSEAHLERYRRDRDGKRLKERKLGVLSDAYVRFFAWAHAALEGRQGALCFVANASFLDGPVHRGMRAALHRSLCAVDITDLGGSSLVARDAQVDDNVFGVRPGVTVFGGAFGEGVPDITYRRLWGRKAQKLQALSKLSGGSSADVALDVRRPNYLFRPVEGATFPKHWLGLTDLMPFHREGVQTNRDAVAIDASRDRLLGRMQAFALGLKRPDLEQAERSSAHYDPERARAAVRAALERDPEGNGWVRPIAYRPMDMRYFVTLPELCHRPRRTLLDAVAESEAVLLTVRKDRGSRPWAHLSISAEIPDSSYLSARSSCRTRAFPTHHAGTENLGPEGKAFAEKLGGPLALLDYAAAFLVSERYRTHFSGALHLDYPRLPPPGADADRLRHAGSVVRSSFLEVQPGNPTHPTYAVGHHEPAIAGLASAAAECDMWVQRHLS